MRADQPGRVVVDTKSEESSDDVDAVNDKGVIGGSDRRSARDKQLECRQ